MSVEKNGKDVWRLVAVSLITTLSTGLGSWVLFGFTKPSRAEVESNYVTKSEMRDYVEQRNPKDTLNKLIVQYAVLETKLDLLREDVRALAVERTNE